MKYDAEDCKNQINHLKRAINSINLVTKWVRDMPSQDSAKGVLKEHNEKIVSAIEDEIGLIREAAGLK